MSTPGFAVGQAWICPGAHGAPRLMFVVGRIDACPDGPVVGVTVTPDPESRAAGWPLVPHLPIRARALAASGASLACADMKAVRAFEEGDRAWRAGCGQVGPAFDCALTEAYLHVVDALQARPAAARG